VVVDSDTTSDSDASSSDSSSESSDGSASEGSGIDENDFVVEVCAGYISELFLKYS
jgi:hypothetical protein